MSIPALARKTVPTVAIVGGGFAGLRCADVLLRSGASVTIFEARDRLGGRVTQALNGGHLVDVGPNWIHGTVGNPILQIAEKKGDQIVQPDERQLVFDAHGNKKTEVDSVAISAEVWAIVVEAFKHSDAHHTEIDAQQSLLDFFHVEVSKRFPHDPRMADDILREAWTWSFYVGEAVERQSLRCFFLEECLDGENVFLASTYKAVLEEVQTTALERAHIQYQTEIVSIQYRDRLHVDQKVCLTTKDGRKQEFDEVVVTCPLGWLKRNQGAFSPQLPTRLCQAIDNISYGRLEKLYVTFPRAFWTQQAGESMTSAESQATEPPSIHFQSPMYHPDPASRISKQWNTCLVSMAHMPSSSSHPTLLFYLYGDCGAHLTTLLEPHVRHSSSYDTILRDFARPFVSRMANYNASDPDCHPTSFLFTSWQNDPFAGYGSYSNFQIGLENGDVDIETMRNAGGLSDDHRGLWLAGEHTAPFVAIGTTTGAYWSGEAVAMRVCRSYGLAVKTGDEDTVKRVPEEQDDAYGSAGI